MMRSRRRPFMALLLIVLLGTWAVGGQVENTVECKEQRRVLVKECYPVAVGSPPSSACCQRIRGTRIECVCPLVTPAVVALIGVDRALKVIQGCGRVVPRHLKCGSITTP